MRKPKTIQRELWEDAQRPMRGSAIYDQTTMGGLFSVPDPDTTPKTNRAASDKPAQTSIYDLPLE